MRTAPLRAVLTGDIIGSTALAADAQAKLPALIAHVFDLVRGQSEGRILHPVDVYRGDGWQGYVAEPEAALWAGLCIRAWLQALIGVDTRVSLAIGAVTHLEPEHVSRSTGEAFERSGRQLEQLEKTSARLACWVPDPQREAGVYQLAADAIVDLMDRFASEWTQPQAQAISIALLYYDQGPLSQQMIAARWQPAPIGQPSVSRHLARGGWDTVQRSLDRYVALVSLLRTEVEGRR